jgi:DNA-binding beta-propeller fold protein YncE
MTRRLLVSLVAGLAAAVLSGCASGGRHAAEDAPGIDTPEAVIRSVGGITLGEPLAVALTFGDDPIVADGAPGRLIRIAASGAEATEFEKPSPSPGFYPTDVKMSGFFVYAVDQVRRALFRFDKDGAYRDVLIDFDEVFQSRRIAPFGLDVDKSGRIAVTDTENHQIILFDSYLAVELVFGSYGSFPGQLDAPEGVSFGDAGELIVADSNNRRIQFFDGGGRFLRAIPSDSQSNPLKHPRRAVSGTSGHVFVADPEAGAVFVFDRAGVLVRTIIPEGVKRFHPTDVALTPSGLVYVTDTANSALFVFR